MGNLDGIIQGFITFFNPSVGIYAIIGFIIGAFFGAVPGLTSVLAIALLLPMTYSMDIVSSLVMCMGIYMAGIYSGSITATTINIPGAPSAMMTAIEGNQLMKRGLGAKALGHAAFASMIGGTIGTLLLIMVSPYSVKLALMVKTPGKFSLILFALIVIILIQRKSIAKGAIATFLGIMFATIGIDTMKPLARFTFGFDILVQGIDMMSVIIGTFAISELLIQSGEIEKKLEISKDVLSKIRRKDFIPTLEEIKSIGLWRYFKSSLIGFFTGVLPGAGGSMAAFISYAEAMRSSKNPEEYGTGSLEGIAAAETANNAMCGGAIVPMLTFGIPGDATTAVLLGVLVINGLQPGPQLMTKQFHLIAPMFAALLVSALVILPITFYLLAPYFIKIVSINRGILYASIATVAIVGSFVSTFSVFQMAITLIFGVIAYFLRKQNYPTVTLLLGFILGPMLEDYFRRGLSLGHGSPLIFFTSPDSLFFLVLTVIFYYFLMIKKPMIMKEDLVQKKAK
ncbi:MAG: Tricarboxylate transporter [candidate division TA06 bacterium 32_111]|jgi:putative tricarboxylic transport membrane protein|nr:MAG: Tricarboxylate transporter [candidate division TA06 bacterium 32_111]